MKFTFGYFLERALRIYVCITLSTYGIGKIVNGQFYQKGNFPESVLSTPVSDLSGFDLAWTFFGHSRFYVFFIGISQLVGGFLLIFNKTKLIGAGILIPILLNIIVIDYAFNISWGAMTSAILYFLSLCFILFYNRNYVIVIFQNLLIETRKASPSLKQKIIMFSVPILIVLIIVLLENQLLTIIGR